MSRISVSDEISKELEAENASLAETREYARKHWIEIVVRAEVSPRPSDAADLLAIGEELGITDVKKAFEDDLARVRRFRDLRTQAMRGAGSIERAKKARLDVKAAEDALKKTQFELARAHGVGSSASLSLFHMKQIIDACPDLFEQETIPFASKTETVSQVRLIGEAEQK